MNIKPSNSLSSNHHNHYQHLLNVYYMTVSYVKLYIKNTIFLLLTLLYCFLLGPASNMMPLNRQKSNKYFCLNFQVPLRRKQHGYKVLGQNECTIFVISVSEWYVDVQNEGGQWIAEYQLCTSSQFRFQPRMRICLFRLFHLSFSSIGSPCSLGKQSFHVSPNDSRPKHTLIIYMKFFANLFQPKISHQRTSDHLLLPQSPMTLLPHCQLTHAL